MLSFWEVSSYLTFNGEPLGLSDPTIWSAGAGQQPALTASRSLALSPLVVLHWLSSLLPISHVSSLLKKQPIKMPFFSQPVYPVTLESHWEQLNCLSSELGKTWTVLAETVSAIEMLYTSHQNPCRRIMSSKNEMTSSESYFPPIPWSPSSATFFLNGPSQFFQDLWLASLPLTTGIHHIS